jgi:hypothetical protein
LCFIVKEGSEKADKEQENDENNAEDNKEYM